MGLVLGLSCDSGSDHMGLRVLFVGVLQQEPYSEGQGS